MAVGLQREGDVCVTQHAAHDNGWYTVKQQQGHSGVPDVKRIDEGLKDREWLVLVMTPAALASPWVQLEVDAAHALVIMKRMRGMIPVMAKPCQLEDTPPTWATLHRYDATRDYRRALTSLSRTLGLVERETPEQGVQSGKLERKTARWR
jgi:hypothetical protein